MTPNAGTASSLASKPNSSCPKTPPTATTTTITSSSSSKTRPPDYADKVGGCKSSRKRLRVKKPVSNDEVLLFRVPPAEARLYCPRVPTRLTFGKLRELFAAFGPLYNIKLSNEDGEMSTSYVKPNQSTTMTPNRSTTMTSNQSTTTTPDSSKSQGIKMKGRYALVHFFSVIDAMNACHTLDGMPIGNTWKKGEFFVLNVEQYTPHASGVKLKTMNSNTLSHQSCIDLMNGIVGFHGWSSDIKSFKMSKVSQLPTGDEETEVIDDRVESIGGKNLANVSETSIKGGTICRPVAASVPRQNMTNNTRSRLAGDEQQTRHQNQQRITSESHMRVTGPVRSTGRQAGQSSSTKAANPKALNGTSSSSPGFLKFEARVQVVVSDPSRLSQFVQVEGYGEAYQEIKQASSWRRDNNSNHNTSDTSNISVPQQDWLEVHSVSDAAQKVAVTRARVAACSKLALIRLDGKFTGCLELQQQQQQQLQQ